MTRVTVRIVGLALLLIVLGSVSVSAPRFRTAPDGGVTDEEYEIYSSVIKQIYVGPETKEVIIEERTFRYDFNTENDEPWRDKRKGLIIDDSAVDDYETRNGEHWLLNKMSFTLPVKANLVTDLDLKVIFHGNWGDLEWINYYRRFPESRGFVMLSRIGFNTDHTQGLLYVGSRCGPGCGDTYFLLLEKTNGTWTTKKELRKKIFG